MLEYMQVPAYLCKPPVHAYLHRVDPWAKAIFILRNPVDRAYSEVTLDGEGLVIDKGDADFSPSRGWTGWKPGFEFKLGERERAQVLLNWKEGRRSVQYNILDRNTNIDRLH